MWLIGQVLWQAHSDRHWREPDHANPTPFTATVRFARFRLSVYRMYAGDPVDPSCLIRKEAIGEDP
jgi:hypothetical protein